MPCRRGAECGLRIVEVTRGIGNVAEPYPGRETVRPALGDRGVGYGGFAEPPGLLEAGGRAQHRDLVRRYRQFPGWQYHEAPVVAARPGPLEGAE